MNKLVSGTLAEKVNNSLVSLAYKQIYLSQVPSIFCATVLLIALYSKNVDETILIAWYGFFWLIAASRMLLGKIYSVRINSTVTLTTWTWLFALGAILGGACWGFAGSVLFLQANANQQILIVLILAGISAAAGPVSAPILSATLFFLTCSLVPNIVVLSLFKQNSIYSLFNITVAAYYIYLILITFRLHAMIKRAMRVNFENETLLENLTQAKSQLELSNERLKHAATHDPLTRVANRSLFATSLLYAIDKARLDHTTMALLYLDLDNFKDVNDEYGHDIGDQVLLNMIDRIKSNIREYDLVGRWGGDEFTILLENIRNGEIVHSVANQLCQVLSKPIIVNSHAISITVSIGISVYPLDGEDADSLLRTADVAMYYVKEHGRNQYQFSQDMAKV